jgi:hypothetical protein
LLGLALAVPRRATAQTQAHLLERLQRLEQKQAEMDEQLKAKDARIDAWKPS